MIPDDTEGGWQVAWWWDESVGVGGGRLVVQLDAAGCSS